MPSLSARVTAPLPFSNCASSVEPLSASVELAPPDTACAISSNQPAPTSRWCLVAV